MNYQIFIPQRNTKLKIVMLCDFYQANLEYQENLLSKYYIKHGHSVTIITSTFDNVFDYYENNHDPKIPEKIYFDGQTKIIALRYKYNLLNKIRPFTKISKILETESPDLIYVHDIIPNMLEAANYVKKNPNCKMIMDYHADYSNSGKDWISRKILHGVIRKSYLDRCQKYISQIFPVVPAGIDFLHDIYKVPHSKMQILPLGADSDLYHKIATSALPAQLRYKYKISKKAKIIVTGGKLSPRKKTELLIKAFLKMDIDNVHLIIIGDSASENKEYKEYLLSLAEQRKDILFVGWLSSEEIYTHFAIADIAIFPASQSILWQQAIASGLPLIVGNTGHQSIEYLNVYDNIIILEKQDINITSIKSVISEILSNERLLQSMHEGAQRVAAEKLDWNNLIYQTLKFNFIQESNNL